MSLRFVPLVGRFAIALLTILSAGCTQKLPDYPPAYREYAYVSNGKSNSVSVLDMRNYRLIATIPVGANPTGIAANPQKNEIYAVNTGGNSISVIDAEQNRVVGTIAVERAPFFIDVSADGKRAYVANSGSNSVSVIDLINRRVLRNIPVGSGPGLARVSKDGTLVIVSERLGNSVSVIDTEKLAVRSSVPVCKQPTDVVILGDSSKAFVACSAADQVASVALSPPGKQAETQGGAAMEIKSSRNSPRASPHSAQSGFGPDRLLALLDVGKTPLHLTLKPDGGEIFVSNFGSDSISEISTATNEVQASHVIGAGPVHAIVSSDSSVLYVSNFNSDTVGIYSVDDGKLIGTVHVGRRPDALALSPNQNFLFVADTAAGDVSVVRTAAKNGAVLLTIIPVGQQPNAIAVKAFILRKPPSPAEQKSFQK